MTRDIIIRTLVLLLAFIRLLTPLGAVHAHEHEGPPCHEQRMHVHVCQLFGLLGDEDSPHHDHDHEADAVYLSDDPGLTVRPGSSPVTDTLVDALIPQPGAMTWRTTGMATADVPGRYGGDSVPLGFTTLRLLI